MEQVAQIAYQPVLGLPLIAWGGLFTFLCFLATALIAILTMKGIKRFPLSCHTTMAYISIASALFHGTIGLLSYI